MSATNLSVETNGRPSSSPSTKRLWAPQEGPQRALVKCSLPEVFFGGARGGGKTDGVLGKWLLKANRYGRHFNAKGFRKTSVSFEDTLERAKEIYLPAGARFTASPMPLFKFANGARVRFGYLETDRDAENEQGKNLTDAWVEEAGQYASPAVIDKIYGALRSAHGVPTQLVLTANPGGSGQGWIRDRYKLVPFPKGPKLVSRTSPTGAVIEMAVIPSRLSDNQELLRADPGYLDRLSFVGSEALIRAWLEGDWNAIEGAFFDGWNEALHVVAPFGIPADWMRFRSMDWGSAKPFSVGWWAVVGDDYPVGGRVLPRGALVRYREWYGSSAPNVGLKLTAEQVGQGIKGREADEKIAYGVLDPAAFAEDGGPSIAERINREIVAKFRPADNKRVAQHGAMGGWDQMRARMRGDGERPMLFVSSTCRDFIRTIPILQHDQTRVEDLDTDAEDHVADEARYACMSRPWTPPTRPKEKPKRDGWVDHHDDARGDWRTV